VDLTLKVEIYAVKQSNKI